MRCGWSRPHRITRNGGLPRVIQVRDTRYKVQGSRAKESQTLGLRIYRCPLWVPRRPSGLKRLLHLASFALSSLPVMLRLAFWRPDVVWVVAPAFFCAPVAWLAARLCGARVWLHVQDYEVDAAFDLGLLKGAWLKKVVLGVERWLMRRFDRVSTISSRMLDRALAKGVAPARALLFPNWADLGAIAPTQDQDSSCKVQGARDKTQGTRGACR